MHLTLTLQSTNPSTSSLRGKQLGQPEPAAVFDMQISHLFKLDCLWNKIGVKEFDSLEIMEVHTLVLQRGYQRLTEVK